MNIILLLVSLWARPELVPVGRAEVATALALEQRFAGSAAAGSPAAAWESPDRILGQYVVGFRPGCEEQVRSALAQVGADVVRFDHAAGFVVCRSGLDRLDFALAGRNEIRYCEPDVRVRASKIPNDPFFLQQQWDKWVMYADKAWDVGTGGGGVKVAVIDNGVEYWHPDLSARFVTGDLGYDFVGHDNDPRPDNPSLPEAFHGTHVSGIIAATMDNSTGVAGWAQVQLVAVRVLNDSGTGDLSDLATGIRWAADHGCRVANMSLGATSSTTPLSEACQYAASANVMLFAAAGNDGAGTIQFPAALQQCVCVGATDEYSGLASFSNYGPEQEAVAPGVDVLSTSVNGGYVLASGTSMACPEVTGVGALVLALNYSLSAARVRAILAASAIDKGVAGRDDHYGYGLVNGARAVQLATLLGRVALPAGPGEHGPAVICRGALQAPSWAEEMAVYDAQGRIVAKLRSGQRAEVSPGSYFAMAWAAGRSERMKFLVPR